MKIGVVIDRLNVGGVEKVAIEQVRALREIGEDAYLVILREKAVVENAFPDLIKQVPILYLDQRLSKPFRFSFQFPLFHFFSSFHVTYPLILPFVVKKNEFDYFIVHGTYTAFSAITIRKIKGIRFSTFIWDPISYILERVYKKKENSFIISVLSMFAGFLDKQIINASDVILAGGDAHNRLFNRINPEKKIIVITPSVNPRKKIVKQKKDYVLMVTAWKKGKNPEYIFELLKFLPETIIVMVGKWLDPLYKKTFEQKVKLLKLSNKIKIIGEVTEKQLSDYYKNALFLLQTNDDRGFGLPALEAAGHGTTFVIPQGQGVCKLFKNKIDGFYNKEKDTKSIVEDMKLLLSNKKLTSKMSVSAWETVKTKYSWKKHGEKLLLIVKTYGEK